MSDLEDYGALLRSGQAAVPDYAADEARKQLLSLQRAQEQRLTAEANREAQEQQGFQADLTTVLAHPSAQGYSALIAKHPKFAQQVKSSWDLLDKNRQDGDLQAMSEIYSAAANGKNDLAAGLMKRRIEADRAAGQDTTHDQAILDALSSGDPVQQKGALGMIGVTLSAVTGPEKFEQTLGQLTKGTTPDIRNVNAGDDVISIDPNTHQATSIYKSPYVKTADGGILERDGTGGGDPASPGAAQTTAPGGFDNAVEHVLSNEGGYNASDMNGAPVNFGINQKANPGVDVKNMTRDQAKQVYHDKYWVPSGAENLPANLQAPYFDVYVRNPAFAKKALADSGGDPAKFMAASSAYFQKLAQKSSGQPYAQAWANRDAKNTAIATGGASSAAAPATEGAPPGYHWLTPPKPKDAPSGYRYAADGNTLEVIPGGPADKSAGDPASPDMLNDAATQFLLTGQMPALGMGGGKLKEQILNKRSELMKKLGIPAERLPAFQAQYAADKKALETNNNMLSSLQSSENALKSNAQQVWNTHHQLLQDGIIADNPAVTRAQLKYYTNFGSPDQRAHVKAYLDAVNAYSTEYSKFMTAANGMGGSAMPSDSARTQAGELNDPGLAATPLLAHLRQGLTEATNKRNGVAKQTQALQDKLSNYLHPQSAEPSGAVQIRTAKDWYALKPGTRYIDPTGVQRVKK